MAVFFLTIMNVFVLHFSAAKVHAFTAFSVQVGIGKDQEMRIVLDTDEERFGGQCRLEEGHGKLPKGGPTHNRPSWWKRGRS